MVVKHDKRGIGASKLPTAKKIYEAPKQRDADSSKAKQGLEVKVRFFIANIKTKLSNYHSSFTIIPGMHLNFSNVLLLKTIIF